MKPWNTWVAWLGCAGLCLALVGCGGSNVPDPESDANAAKGTLPSAEPSAPAVAPSAPEPAPEPTAAPAPTAAPEPAPAPAPAPAAAEPPPAQPKPEEAAASKPAEPPAAAAGPPATPGATASPAPAASADGTAKADANNPFAVFSETQAAPPASASSTPAAGAAAAAAPAAAAPAAAATAEVPPPEVPPGDNPPAAEGNQGPLGFLEAAAANRGNRKQYTNPMTAATAFLAAIKSKDLNKVAQATALRAATESKNQKLFQLILAQELAQEDLDELAKKLAGYTVTGSNQPKSTGTIGITVTKTQGKSTLRRNLTMRHEKAGWKVQDIGGEGEMQMQIMMPRMGGRSGGRR